MPHAIWSLQNSAAKLELDSFTAQVDLRQPQCGLNDIHWRAQSLAGHEILAVELASRQSAPDETLADCYQRAGDLVAVYAQTPQRPMRVQIYWRASLRDSGGRRLPCIDLQASVQTALLDARPELTTSSTLPAGEVRRLVDPSSGVFEALLQVDAAPLALTPQEGPGCLLFRWPQSDVSYAEMIAPCDFDREELSPSSGGRLKLSRRLFAGSLEKGVILRARLCGVYLEREDDERCAAEAYRAFLDSPPPLTA